MGQSKLPISTILAMAGLSIASSLAAQTLPDWIAVDSTGKSVTLTLLTTAGPDSGTGLLNGHHNGDIQVVVPLGWTVRWSWKNADSSASHSLVVMAEREKLPLEGGRPALDNAMSRMVTAGLKPGQKDETTFVADQAGWYWLLCGVPGHALKGEWISLKIDREATSVAIKQK
jgi:uncharacterized cupredoxin-like copper-binding protein